jgi:hypothetical protein
MTEWFDIEEEHYNELLRLSRVYHREAVRCRDAKAYIAGCTMAGAALESILLAMLHLYGSEVETAGFAPKRQGKTKKLLDWRLPEMLHAAAGIGWLPRGLKSEDEWNSRLAEIGDYAEALRQTRNLVHPARYLQDHSPSRVTKKYLISSLEIFEVASQYLESKVHESLRSELDAEESKKAIG